MKKLDWKLVGQLVSVLLGLFTLIRDTFAKMGVGIEVVGWLIGDGRQVFVEEFLRPLGQRYLATQKPAPKLVKSVTVDLDVFPSLPFNGASVIAHIKGDKVKLERRGDDLYIDGRKVVLYLSEHQQNGKTIKGTELREELTGKPVLNANVLDALYEHPELIPESWKVDEQGRTRYIYFWGTIYRDFDGNLYVRYLCFGGGQWDLYYYWLDFDWGVQDPAAVSA